MVTFRFASIPGGDKDLSYLQNTQPGSGAHLDFYSRSTDVSYPGGISTWNKVFRSWILPVLRLPHSPKGVHSYTFSAPHFMLAVISVTVWYAEWAEMFCSSIQAERSQPKCSNLQILQRGNIFTMLSVSPKNSYVINNVTCMTWFRYTSFSMINFKHCLTYILDNSYVMQLDVFISLSSILQTWRLC
jgi:hypothetical protein